MILANYKLKHCFEIISNTFESITKLTTTRELCSLKEISTSLLDKVAFYRIITKNSNFRIILSINLEHVFLFLNVIIVLSSKRSIL